ncbi:helix-turn-helix domain-containing protein [Hymenobacter sp. PAMC 26628]|uniref:helix-turn-helix domain-containing protein n=1 Tax=Hymenobacter sp. PAMC 26628 TaxID=1484118 RepID=UPI0007702324|nr:AraC family transcriptional regulator [Hymenobacter sp. PAMC 26628]AMJ67810.1 transcriptional regulator [Hymenobacter sp. PAMC 26628]
MEKPQNIEEFYRAHLALMPTAIQQEVGHFNVLRWADLDEGKARCSSFSRQQFYKITLISGDNTYHYANRSVRVEKNALVFSNPLVPYHWELHDEEQTGMFCIFTEDFLLRHAPLALAEYPLFRPGGQVVFQLTDAQYQAADAVFASMVAELESDYLFKYDVLRNATLDLIHMAQRLQPAAARHQHPNAPTRIAALFMELLERQFPIESPGQRVRLRFPVEFAAQLAIHVNHLNKALKETTGQTTSALLAARLMQEARSLLRHTVWSVSDIGWCLGFEELPHFINFFRKHTRTTPNAFRRTL